MALDVTPVRKDSHGLSGNAISSTYDERDVSKTQNRTFADSVLRQGFLGQKAQLEKGRENIKGDQTDFDEPAADETSPVSTNNG